MTPIRFLTAVLLAALLFAPAGWAADKKISQLQSIITLTDGDEGVANQGGITKKWAFSLLKTYLGTTAHYADLSIHRALDDAQTTTTNLWSASKINTELGTKAASSHTHAAADITSGTFGVTRGGTGATTLTTNGVLLGNGTSAVSATAAGSAYQVLRVPSGGGAPAFGAIDLSQSSAVTGTLPSANFDTIPISKGGSGQTSQTAGFDALAPTTTKGDIIVHNGSDNIRVAVGSNDQVLTADSAQASGVKWASSSASGLTLLSVATASSSAQVDVETTFDSTYEEYILRITDLVPATDDTYLTIRVKVSGSYQTANYMWLAYQDTGASSTSDGSISTALQTATINISNGTGEAATFEIHISNPAGTARNKIIWGTGVWSTGNGPLVRPTTFSGAYTGSQAAVTGLRFLMNSGNITSGTFRLYGVKKSAAMLDEIDSQGVIRARFGRMAWGLEQAA